MSVEGGGDSLKQLRERLSPEFRQRAEDGFDDRSKINQDYTNAWAFLAYVEYDRDVDSIQLVQLYEQYFRSKPQEPKDVVDYIMSMSDPASVAALDHAVKEFNADLERIKQEEDWETVRNFIAKMKQLMGRK